MNCCRSRFQMHRDGKTHSQNIITYTGYVCNHKLTHWCQNTSTGLSQRIIFPFTLLWDTLHHQISSLPEDHMWIKNKNQRAINMIQNKPESKKICEDIFLKNLLPLKRIKKKICKDYSILHAYTKIWKCVSNQPDPAVSFKHTFKHSNI